MKTIRITVWVIFGLAAAFSNAWGGLAISPLYFFSGGDGSQPNGRLIQARDGNLYGTTSRGGASNLGTIFKMTTNGVLTSLVSFGSTNGANPNCELVQGSDGNLYGTTSAGGRNGSGTVFQLDTNGVLTALVSFVGTNGSSPCARLVQGGDGCLYGTAYSGGANSKGTVFKLTTDGVLTTLVSFNGTNGSNPYAGLVQASDGNFYGTTTGGGAGGAGTFFTMTEDGDLTNLCSFSGATGSNPSGGLVEGQDGNFYGITAAGGAMGAGTIYQMSKGGLLKVLYAFPGFSVGAWPARLVQAADGCLYGTAYSGGAYASGRLFQLSTNGTFTVLADCISASSPYASFGNFPAGGLLLGAGGELYGVSSAGGYKGNGAVFRLDAPQSSPQIVSQPRSQASLPGSSVTFSVAADGHLPLYYQWYRDGVPLLSATNASYTVTSAQVSDARAYTVTVSNFVGCILSSNAVLTVASLVITQQPSPGIVSVGYDTTFRVAAAGAAPLAYQWRKEGNDIPLATNSTFALTNVQSGDAGGFSVVVTNADGCLTSAVVSLTVVSPYTFGTVAGKPRVYGEADGAWNSAQFYGAVRVVSDRGGNLFVSDASGQTIRKIAPEGVVSTVAGLAGVQGTNDGLGSAARFSHPEGLALDEAGNLYVADNSNHTIRKITPDGLVTTLAGLPGQQGFVDGPAHLAKFGAPSDVAVDGLGNIYVAEWGNRAVRKITPGGCVVTVAGPPFQGTFGGPVGIALDKQGKVYVADQTRGPSGPGMLQKVIPGGAVSAIATFACAPYGLALDELGNCYVGMFGDQTVRQVTPEGQVLTLAGVSGASGYADGAGSAARFNASRFGITRDALGNLYVAEDGNCLIRKGVRFPVTAAPQSQAALAGTPVTLGAAVADASGYSFQWLSNGVALAGETNLTLELGAAGRGNSGWYSLDIQDSSGTAVRLNALVRALVPPVLQPPQGLANQGFRLTFQDADGGLPYDLSKVQLQWRTNLDDTNWQSYSRQFSATNGRGTVDDTNASVGPSRFYRILEF